LGARVSLIARFVGGAWIAGATDPISGTATTGSARVPIGVTQDGERVVAAVFVARPELGVDVRLGGLAFGTSLAALFVLGDGPQFHHDAIEVEPVCGPSAPGQIGCARSSGAVHGERAFGPFALLLPTLSATYTF